jgi:hypothetical protein
MRRRRQTEDENARRAVAAMGPYRPMRQQVVESDIEVEDRIEGLEEARLNPRPPEQIPRTAFQDLHAQNLYRYLQESRDHPQIRTIYANDPPMEPNGGAPGWEQNMEMVIGRTPQPFFTGPGIPRRRMLQAMTRQDRLEREYNHWLEAMYGPPVRAPPPPGAEIINLSSDSD